MGCAAGNARAAASYRLESVGRTPRGEGPWRGIVPEPLPKL
eukprot:gene15472-biopygen662